MLHIKLNQKLIHVNPIQDGGGAKIPPPVTPANARISPKNFLTFSFNPFATLVENFKDIPSASPQIIELEPRLPLKKSGFSGQILRKLRL